MGWLEVHRTVRGVPMEFREEFSDDFTRTQVSVPPRTFIVHPDGRLEDVTDRRPVSEPGDHCISIKVTDDPFKPKASSPEFAAEARSVQAEAEAPRNEENDEDYEDDEEKDHPLHVAIENMLNGKPPSEAELLPESLPKVSEWDLGGIDHLGPRGAYKMLENLEAHQELVEMRGRARRTVAAVRNLVEANRAPRCMQIKSDGTTCQAPAWGDRLLCYFHVRTQMKHYTEPDSNKLELPVLEDTRSLQVAITQICRFMADNRIDVRTGRALLYGIRMAERNLVEEEA
ncbi:MAG TPA: hypothetical protein VFQ00_07630 [Terriglobales bacterium]|nr:hypothetical protein [Terriglobales bacterium]